MSENDLTLDEDLKTLGPLSVKGNLKINGDLKVMGPAQIGGELSVTQKAKITGPLTADSISETKVLKVMGPLTVDQDIQVKIIKITGPVTVDGHFTATDCKIMGPFDGQEIQIENHLTICGPLECISATGKNISVRGPVKATESISAEESIDIVLEGRCRSKNPIEVGGQLKAKEVTIASKNSFHGDLINVNVDITADKVILDGVRHSGRLDAKDVEYLNGAVHEKD